MKFIQREDGETIEFSPGDSENNCRFITCCDCGLVHKMGVAIEDNGNIGISFEQDEEETIKRRGRTVNEEIVSPYQELIMSVEDKYEGESRHQTALRYIKEARNLSKGAGAVINERGK